MAVREEDDDGIVYADKQLVIKRTSAPDGLCITGVIDLFNVDRFARSLNSSLAGDGDLHIDLGRLEFCDVSGIRVLVAAAERLHGGRRLVLHGLAPQLRTVMAVVGWSELPGLAIGDLES